MQNIEICINIIKKSFNVCLTENLFVTVMKQLILRLLTLVIIILIITNELVCYNRSISYIVANSPIN